MQSGERGAVVGAQRSEMIVVKGTDLEVSALIVAMDDPLGEAAVQKSMHTKRIDAKPLQNVNGIIASQPWLRTYCRMIAVACRLRLDASVIVKESVNGTVSETASEIGTLTALVLGARTKLIMTVSAVTGMKNERNSIDAVSIEVRMMSCPTVTVLRPRADDAPTMKMTTRAEIQETLRYDCIPPSRNETVV